MASAETSARELRRQAATVGAQTFLSSAPCSKGHTCPRYTSNGHCVECKKFDAAARYAEDRSTTREAVAGSGGSRRCGSCKQDRPSESFFNGNGRFERRCTECRMARNILPRSREAVRRYTRTPKGAATHHRNDAERFGRPGSRERVALTSKRLRLRKVHGLTLEQRDAMMAAQNHSCAICSRHLDGGKHTHVDHCHRTGKIRGLLCQKCDLSIGHFGDDPATLRAAADYVEGHQQ